MSSGTGGLILGLAGAIIGNFLLPGYGAQLGFVVGSLVGNLAFPPKLPDIVGPQLNDLKGQASQPGRMIPILRGGARFAGTVIYESDLIPVTTSEELGGKGGPTQTQTTTTYFVDVAILLSDCKDGPITGIGRIWNTYTGTLVADFRSTAGLGSLQASNNIAQSIVVYPGSSSQLPDPTLEANLGVGNVPAYRYRSYIVFTRLALASFANQLPNLEFEVIAAGSIVSYREVLRKNSAFSSDATDQPRPTWPRIDNGVLKFNIYRQGSSYRKQHRFDYAGNELPGGDVPAEERYEALIGRLGSQPVYWDNYTAGGQNRLIVGTTQHGYAHVGVGIVDGDLIGACVDPQGSRLYVLSYQASPIRIEMTVYDDTMAIVGMAEVTTPLTGLLAGRVFPGYDGGTLAVESDNLHLWTRESSTNIKCYEINADYTLTLLGSTAISPGSGFGSINWGGAGDGLFFIAATATTSGYDSSNFLGMFTRFPAISKTTIALADVVSMLCKRTNADSAIGLVDADIDVSALTETIDGYLFSAQSPARSGLEQLAQIGFFDAADIDGKLKFVLRGGSSVVDIPDDDLGAYLAGGTPVDPIAITRAQETEMPQSMAVLFQDPAYDYQIASQSSRRISAAHGGVVTVQSPVVMSATKAKEVADVLRYDAMNARDTFAIALPRKYCYLSPTDIIQANGRKLRLVQKHETTQGIFNWQTAAEDGQVYIKNNPAAVWSSPPVEITLPGPTELIILDLPTLRDADDGGVVYIAVQGLLSGWSGANIYKSLDDSVYSLVLTVSSSAIIGFAQNAWGSFSGGNIVDELTSLTVDVGDAILSSCTYTELLNGSNAFAIAASDRWEVAQFRTATLNGDGTYTLTGFLRGRKGSESAIANHAFGDRFVMLTQGIYKAAEPLSDMRVTRYWKAASLGTIASDTAGQAFTDSGASLKPLSPVLLGGGRDASGNISLKWVRRTRIGQEWLNVSGDVPIAETSERYEVDIFSSSGYTTVKRTISGLGAQTATYSAADQTTDFGSTQSTIYFKVYQLSDLIGRGYSGIGQV